MPAISELSRRRFVKAIAGGATAAILTSIPLLGERGRVRAQEATPQQTEETHIIIPKSETLEEQLNAFNSLVTRNMKPEALKTLGIASFLTEKELKKKYEDGTFTTSKEKPIAEATDITYLEYSLKLPNTKHPFLAWYVYDDKERNVLWENIIFVSDTQQGLRQNGDNAPLAYNDLQSNAEFFFNLPADGMKWKDFSEIVPEEKKDAYKDIGIYGGWEKDTPLVEAIVMQLQTNGFVGYTHLKGEPKVQGTQNTQQKMNRGLEMALLGREMVLERISTRFNTPQV